MSRVQCFVNIYTSFISDLFLRLKKFQNQVPSSNLKRLEAMIPKLTESSTKLSKNLTLMSIQPESLNGKRDYKEFGNDDDEDDIVEIKPAANGYKKVKSSSIKEDAPDIILVGTAFAIKFLCHADIQNFLPPERQYRYGEWSSDGKEGVLILKREDFLFLPTQVTLRLSKEHAKVTATKKDGNVIYEITDLSVNGTYYLGNRIDGTMKQGPVRLQKNIPFKLKNGDWICMLLKKESKANEVLLGFEFELPEN